MIIYPTIDLKSGQCVRLYQGCYNRVKQYEKSPIDYAKSFVQQGAQYLHIIDLDGAKEGVSVNLDLIIKMKQETGLFIQTGGGIRSKEQIKHLLNCNINRVILGSIAVTHVREVKTWIEEFGFERITLALDVRINENDVPKLATHGWQTSSDKTLWDLLDDYAKTSLSHVLCTDIARDGTLEGPNFALYQECIKRYPTLKFQAAGGVRSLKELRELSNTCISGAIIGKALYENKFSLRNALDEVAYAS